MSRGTYWIVAELFFPDEVSTAKILTDIAKKKNEQNEVSVICGPSGYEKTYLLQNVDLEKDIIVYRNNLPPFNKNNLFQRIIRLFLLSIKLSWNVFKKVQKRETVLITTNPSFLILVLPVIKIFKGFYIELLVHDVFPENLIPAGLIKKDGIYYRLLKKVFSLAYNKVDRIIVIGQDMKEEVLKKIPKKPIKIEIIPNWYEPNIYPINNFDIGQYLKLEVSEKIVLSFAGNLGRVQGIIELIDLLKESKNDDLILTLIGDGALRELVTNKLKLEKISNVFYLGPKPRKEQNLFLNACHIAVVTLAKGMKGLGVPSKTYNILASGKPIFYIGDKESEIDKYISENDCGWSYNWDERDKAISFLKNLSELDLSEINRKGANAFNFSRNFEKDILLNKF